MTGFVPTPLGWLPRPAMPPEPDYPEVAAYPALTADSRVLDCAVCGRLLLGMSDEQYEGRRWRAADGLPELHQYTFEGRPRCSACDPRGGSPTEWRPATGDTLPTVHTTHPFLRGLLTEGGRRVVRRWPWGDENPWGDFAVRAGEDAAG